MAFLRREGEDGGRRLQGVGVYLRHPELRDYDAWARTRAASRAFLQPWEPTWGEDELTRATYRMRLKRYGEDIRDGRAYPFFTFRAADGALVGGLTLSRVQRGVSQSAALGYWAAFAHRRQGHTRAAVRAALRFAFEELALHRVEAACQPENAASRALLESVGFQHEGYARGYLKIAGEWRDHLLFAILAQDPIR